MVEESRVGSKIETVHRPVSIKWIGEAADLPDNVIAGICKHGVDHSRTIYKTGDKLKVRGVDSVTKEQLADSLVGLGLERTIAEEMSTSVGDKTFTFFGCLVEGKSIVVIFDRPAGPQPEKVPYRLILARAAISFGTSKSA